MAERALAAAAAGGLDPDSRLGRFHRLMRAEGAADRAAAAWAMGETRLAHPTLRDDFAGLLEDAAPAVRLAALAAAGRLSDPRFVPFVVRALGEPGTAAAALEALGALDDAAVPAVETALYAASGPVLARTTSAPSRTRGPAGDALLARLLRHDNRVARYRAARALAARRAAPGFTPPAPDVLLEAAREEIRTGYRYWAILAGIAKNDGVDDYEVDPRFAFLAGEVRARIRQTERRLFALCALAGDPKLVRVAEARLRSGDSREVARAVELLENAVAPTEMAALAVAFLEPRPLRQRQQAAGAFPGAAQSLADPLAELMTLGDPHLRRSALVGYRERIAAEYPDVWKEDSPVLPLVERIYFLRNVPLFSDLSGEDLKQVAEIAGQVALAEGDVVFKKGDPGDVLYIVAAGAVAVKDGARTIATFAKNEFFGELALLDGEARSADAVCAEKSELLSLARADLEELVERRPEIAREIIRVLTRRLRAANLRPEGS